MPAFQTDSNAVGKKRSADEMMSRPAPDDVRTRSEARARGFRFNPYFFEFLPPLPKLPAKAPNPFFKRATRADGSTVNPFALGDRSLSRKSVVYIAPNVRRVVTARVLRKVTKVRGNRNSARALAFGTPSPRSKMPRKAITPGGTELHRRATYGCFAVYTEGATPDLSAAPDFDSHTKKKIASTLMKSKDCSFHVTADDIRKSRAQTRSSQKSVMGLSAADAFKMSDVLNDPVKKHWMHLIAFFMLGKQSMIPENLAAGSAHSNYRHHNLELEVPYLLQFFPEGLDVKASVITDENDVGHELSYTISAPNGFEIQFKMGMQSAASVARAEAEYVHAYTAAAASPFKAKRQRRRALDMDTHDDDDNTLTFAERIEQEARKRAQQQVAF